MSDKWCSNTHTLPQRSFADAHNRHACNQLLQVAVSQVAPWAARYNTWLLIELTPKVAWSFLFFSFLSQVASKSANKLTSLLLLLLMLLKVVSLASASKPMTHQVVAMHQRL